MKALSRSVASPYTLEEFEGQFNINTSIECRIKLHFLLIPFFFFLFEMHCQIDDFLHGRNGSPSAFEKANCTCGNLGEENKFHQIVFLSLANRESTASILVPLNVGNRVVFRMQPAC